ncbi:WD repeat-containing protein 47-like isoform X2 [Convolutriloba macropyga]|uniref:WD repeat-containing protein 47-like isoform X2 n=1 Tax=Convolutriloba macropyga TaxID=536237 RepID=UPI003F525D3B
MPEKQISAALGDTTDPQDRTILNLKEAEVVKIMLEFLNMRGFHISMRALERESGLVNGLFSDDVLFLRHLILDGQWEDVLQFIQPLETASQERYNFCRFVILREKYLEMLCMKNEKDLLGVGGGAGGGSTGTASILEEFNIDEVVACLHSMERICPSREEYNSLCLLLTVQKLSDHPDFKSWNPSSARLQCFEMIRPVVEKILPADSNLSVDDFTASRDRLMQIVVHGLLYECCLDFCQSKAISSPVDQLKQSRDSEGTPEKQSPVVRPADVLAGVNVLRSSLNAEGDPSLISWLDECVPHPVFSAPFEQRDLTVNVGKIVKPPSASWFEQILLTPTPAQLTPGFTKSFPSPITRFASARPKTADKLSMSLDVGNMGAVDYRSGSGQMPPSTSANPYLMPPQMSGAAGRDVSKSYAHFSYKPMHSTIEEGNEEMGVPGHAQAFVEAPGDGNFETPRNRQSHDYQSGLRNGQSSFQVRASAAISSMPKEDLSDYHNQSQNPQIDCSFERLNLNADRNSIAEDSLRRDVDGRARSRKSSASSNRDSLRQLDDVANQVTPSKNQSLFPGHNLQISTPKHPSVAPPLVPGMSSNVPSLRQSNTEPQRSQSSVANSGTNSQRRLSAEFTNQNVMDPSSNTLDNLVFTKSVVLSDVQAVRSVAFHPNGVGYAVGANTKVLRVFPSPNNSTFINFNSNYPEKQNSAKPPMKPLWAKKDVHKGSIYCVDWSLSGDLIATGSNDKMIKIIPVDPITQQLRGGCAEIELAMHDGTVRDVVFTSSASGIILGSPLLVSGGAGDCNIYVTDCQQAKAMHAFAGHSGPILSLFSYGTHNLCSGSQDKTVRLWDIRSGKCTHVINTDIPSLSLAASPACAVSVNGSGTLLAFGTEDAKVVLLDIRRAQFPHLATLDCHSSDVRAVRFAPSNPNYLLTGSYDSKLAVTYCGGPTPQSAIVGKHDDKVIQCRWNPSDLTFVSTSADRSACYWTLESNFRG